VQRHTIIAQRLAPIAAISRMEFPVSDVAGPSSSLRAWERHLLLHGKHHYFAPAEVESNRRWKEIVGILAQGQDPSALHLFSVMVAVISPLTVSTLNVDLLRLACAYDAPVVPTVCPMAGSTAPYTRASTLLVGHAENLAMAALTQIVKPGQPFLYSFGPSVMDLASAHDLYYTLDKVLWKIAAVQLAKSYNLPVTAECGGTMTYRYDQQNGMEGFSFMLAAVASGADVFAGFGSCYTAMGMSAEMMVIQEAWLEAARFLQRGITTDEASLGLNNIRQAGPGGNFLTDELTLQFRNGGEFFSNPLFDLKPCAQEQYPLGDSERRSRSMLQRAHEEVEELVAGFKSPVPHDIQEALMRYFHDECAKLEA
jgi:trimethylamine--corrinoid protein Co-methyltransferase